MDGWKIEGSRGRLEGMITSRGEGTMARDERLLAGPWSDDYWASWVMIDR